MQKSGASVYVRKGKYSKSREQKQNIL